MKQTECEKYTLNKNRNSFVQDARELATHFISFLFEAWSNSVSFAVFISFSGGFCFCRSFSVYFMFVNIKYLGKIKRKMRHCWTKEQQNNPVCLPKICVQRCFLFLLIFSAHTFEMLCCILLWRFYCIALKQANSLVLHEMLRVWKCFSKRIQFRMLFFTLRMIRMNSWTPFTSLFAFFWLCVGFNL